MTEPEPPSDAPSRPAFLSYQPAELRFGTSGLRGLVTDMTDLEVYLNARGYLDYLVERGELERGEPVALAEDLRETDPASGQSSSPRIAAAVSQAVRDGGFALVYCGRIPTPALAYYAMGSGSSASPMPGIMVTGSHVPADRNGVKFYKKSGEVLKEDEAGIARAVGLVRAREYARSASQSLFDAQGMLSRPPEMPAVQPHAERAYVARYVDLFAPARPLAGQRVVVVQHSAVGRDLLVETLQKLGARVFPADRSEVFVAVDTEDVSADDERHYRALVEAHRATALVSTDGDGDRPLVVDERGAFHRGDVLGIVAAELLRARFCAVPISTSDAVDRRAAARLDEQGQPLMQVAKTRIGSPYVIAAMQRAAERGLSGVVGWEANGGFLTASDFALGRGILTALPTRDAVLPIVAALVAAVERGLALSELFAELPPRATRAGLIDGIPPETSQAIVASFSPSGAQLGELRFDGDEVLLQSEPDGAAASARSADEATGREALDCRQALQRAFSAEHGFSPIARINYLDGVRCTFENGDIAHLRPSGNAPQLRIYAVSDTQQRADEIVSLAIAEPDGLIRRMEREQARAPRTARPG